MQGAGPVGVIRHSSSRCFGLSQKSRPWAQGADHLVQGVSYVQLGPDDPRRPSMEPASLLASTSMAGADNFGRIKENGSAEELFSSIGRLVVYWARLEFALDLLLLISHRKFTGAVQWLNPQLSEKIATARREIVPRLPQDQAGRLAAILDEIDEHSKARHSIVHGSV